MTSGSARQDRLRSAIDESLSRRPSDPAAVTSAGSYTFADLARLLPRFDDRPRLVRVSDRSIDDLAFAVSAVLAGRAFRLASPGEGAGKDVRAAAEEAVESSETPTDVVYLTSSSGTSSGKPSTHLVSRESLDLYLDGLLDRLQPPERSSFAVCTPLWYDLSYTSLFGALSTGGCLHLIPEGTCSSPRLFSGYLRSHRVGYLKITPTLFSALISPSGRHLPLPTTGVIFGGELLPWSLVEKVRTATGIPRLFNHYGPAETTIGVCAGEVAQHRGDTASVPVGAPLRHVDASVAGAAPTGELLLSGPQVAANQRLAGGPVSAYRTKDLVRALPGGGFEFLGRLDRLVKIRGQFVDLDLVERLVSGVPGVAHASVRGAGDEFSDRLVVLATPEEGARLDRSDVYRYLDGIGHEELCQSEVHITGGVTMRDSGKRK